MDCEELAERLTDLLEGDLDDSEEEAAVEHLATCRSCETVLSGTRDAIAAARDHGRLQLSEDDRDRLWSRVASELPTTPSDE